MMPSVHFIAMSEGVRTLDGWGSGNKGGWISLVRATYSWPAMIDMHSGRGLKLSPFESAIIAWDGQWRFRGHA
jgi:hypothetical protein